MRTPKLITEVSVFNSNRSFTKYRLVGGVAEDPTQIVVDSSNLNKFDAFGAPSYEIYPVTRNSFEEALIKEVVKLTMEIEKLKNN